MYANGWTSFHSEDSDDERHILTKYTSMARNTISTDYWITFKNQEKIGILEMLF